MRTAKEIVDQTNELARQFAAIMGWVVPEDYEFHIYIDARSRDYWYMARAAQIELTETDPNDAIDELMNP